MTELCRRCILGIIVQRELQEALVFRSIAYRELTRSDFWLLASEFCIEDDFRLWRSNGQTRIPFRTSRCT